jgi:hypothetical protein
MADTFNYEDTILSQFANSPTILSLIGSFSAAVDPSANIDAFYDLVWNIDTAEGYGLDVWGRIVGVTRVLQVENGEVDFGFAEADASSVLGSTFILGASVLGYEAYSGGTAQPFGQGVFYNGTPTSSNYTLSDDAFRTLILAKALANISQSNIHAYNTILMTLFPNRGNAFVTDSGNMQMNLVFMFPLQPFEIAIILQSGAFTPPTGVGFNVMVAATPTFGFAEAGASAAGFNVGTFFAGFAT